MKNINRKRNAIVYAENYGHYDGYKVYIDFSGKSEFIYHHRHNGLLYNVLKDGINIDELKRMKFKSQKRCTGKKRTDSRQRVSKLEDSVKQLIKVIDEYLAYETVA